MDNIFDTLKGQLPRPSQIKPELQDKQPKPKTSLKDMVLDWQQNPTTEKAGSILEKLRPTISSALNTYAPGSGSRLEIKAAKLTMDSLKSYDASKGADPATFVFSNLRRLQRLNSRAGNIIQQSESVALDRRRVMDAAAQFEDRKGREPSAAELADLTGFSVKKIDRLMDSSNVVINESSTLSEDSRKDTMAKSMLTDDDYFEYVYSSVSPIDQKIMEWSSGKHGKPLLSNNAIAGKLHISPAAISQRRNKIQSMLSDVRGLV